MKEEAEGMAGKPTFSIAVLDHIKVNPLLDVSWLNSEASGTCKGQDVDLTGLDQVMHDFPHVDGLRQNRLDVFQVNQQPARVWHVVLFSQALLQVAVTLRRKLVPKKNNSMAHALCSASAWQGASRRCEKYAPAVLFCSLEDPLGSLRY